MSDNKEPQMMTKAKVRTIYFGMFMTLATTFIYPILKQKYPELLETEQEHKMIHEEAEKVALNFPTLMKAKHEKEAKDLDYKLRMLNNKIVRIESKIELLSEDLQAYKVITDGINKHVDFNSYNVQTNSEAIFDLMKNDDSCPIVRYTRNQVDRYVLFDDWYGYRTLQPIIAGSGCRIKVTPFDRNRITL